MKITITSDQYPAFLQALQHVDVLAKSKTTLATLSSILLTAEKGFLSIQGNNLNEALLFRIPADVKKEGRVGVQSSDILKVATLSSSLDMELVKAEFVCRGQGTYRLLTLSPEDFPQLPTEVGLGDVVSFTREGLQSLFSCVYAASDPRDNRLTIQGVCVNVTVKQGVAINGKMLAASSYPLAEEGYGPIVPTTACKMLLALSKEQEMLKVGFSSTAMRVEGDVFVFYSRLIEGNYPNFQSILPRTAFEVSLDRKSFLSALDRAVVAQSDINLVTLLFSLTHLTLSVVGKNASTEIDMELGEKVPKQVDGFKIGFDSRFLRDAASHDSQETLSLGFVDTLSPIAIKGEHYVVIMPMRIK